MAIHHRANYFLLINLFLCLGYIHSASANDFNVNRDGVAMHGYDPVAYFNHEPLQGDPRIAVTHAGVIYHFATLANMKLFRADTNKYIPQFGGYCSYGVRMGKKLDIDPESYAIRNNQLYLLLNRSTKEVWDKDRDRNIAIAHRLWPSIKPVPANELNGDK